MSTLHFLVVLLVHTRTDEEFSNDIESMESAEKVNCSSAPQVICIGLEAYGQSLCRRAIASNLSVIEAFDARSTASQSQPIWEIVPIAPEQQQCYQDITVSNIDTLPDRLSALKTTAESSKSVTALIGMSSSLDSLDSVVPIMKQCLSHSVNVVSIMTPELSPSALQSADSTTLSTLHELHRLAMDNNVRFQSRGLAAFLRSTLDDDRGHQELVGRVTCNADYIAYIHRMEKPNVWFDWFIGERVASYHDEAASLSFYKLMRSELRVLTQSLATEEAAEWRFTFSSKALYDQHGETVSKYLNRIIETGRITAIRYNGRLMREDTEESVHIVVKVGVFKDAEQRRKLMPCHVEWEWFDSDGQSVRVQDIKQIDIIAAMMDDAVRNVLYDDSGSQNCGTCCHEEAEIQRQCLQMMHDIDRRVKSEL